jgi:hypothetical protein
MPLPSGNWTLNSNGIPGSLQINPVDVAGSVNGTIVTAFDGIQRPISGLWDEMLQNVTFAVGWSDGVYAGTGYIGFLIKGLLGRICGRFADNSGPRATELRGEFWLPCFELMR